MSRKERGSLRAHLRRALVPTIGLSALTLASLLPFAPQGPFDARDYSRLPGMRLEFPAWGALIEPLAAVGHILAGAPDFRIAGPVTLLWVMIGAALWKLARDLRAPARRPVGAIAGRVCARAASCAGVLLCLTGFAAFIRLPSWRLVVDDPGAIVADFQSHTLRSHDGIVSAEESLRWHAARGYSLVAVTEHLSPQGSFAADALSRRFPSLLPPVLPGIEVASERNSYLLGLGLSPDGKVAKAGDGPEASDFADRFVRNVHDDFRGAVIALARRLTPREVDALADIGVDGFEIANFSRADTPPGVREELLRVARARGLALVASSDWHGWGGFARTWTVIHGADDVERSPQQRAAFVLSQLRAHRAGDFVPVVAGYLGPPSGARALFSPVVETLRYAAELSPPRVLSWWAWTAILFIAREWLSRRVLQPGRVLLAALLCVLGVGLALRGASLVRECLDGVSATSFPAEVGAEALVLGLAALASSAALAVSAREERPPSVEPRERQVE